MLVSGLLAYYNILLFADMYMFVFLTIVFFYDGPAMMHLTVIHMLSSKEIIDGPNRYWSSFALQIGGVSAYFVSLKRLWKI